VEYLKYLGIMITVIQDVHIKSNPELTWQKESSTRRRIVTPANWT